MSMVSLEALCVFVDAMDTTGTAVALRDIVRVLEHLDSEGWEIARKPAARAVTVNDPVPAPPPAEQTEWPPSGISRLWATDMEPNNESMIPVIGFNSLRRCVERGATFIEAQTSTEASQVFRDRHNAMTSTITVGEDRIPYYSDEIPF